MNHNPQTNPVIRYLEKKIEQELAMPDMTDEEKREWQMIQRNKKILQRQEKEAL